MTIQEKPKSEFQEVIFADKAHEQLLKGATILAQAVGSTMGPSGHNVIIDSSTKAPLITKDGVTVAKSIHLKDKMERIGASLIYEIAQKTNELAGDGTTTASVLGHGLLAQGIKMVATGRSAISIKKGMDMASQEAIKFLRENSVPVRDKQDIISVGTISANGDVQIGTLLSDAIEKVGKHGIITCEPSKGVATKLEISEGLQFDSGYISPFFVTNGERLTCEFENPYILVSNKKISAVADILRLLEQVHQTNRPLVIIADEIEAEALHTLIINKTKGILPVCAIKAPAFGEFRTDILNDISTVVGGEVFDLSSEQKLTKITLDQLGTCKRIIIGRNITTIVGAPSNRKQLIDERVETIRAALSSGVVEDLQLERLRRRLAKLAGGVAVVKVGGSTEVEILERKDRVEDALNATVAATQEGIVPGGGTALFYAAQHLKKVFFAKGVDLSEDILAGVTVVINACEVPLRKIVSNTGVSADVVVSRLKENLEISNVNDSVFKNALGYDAANHTYTNLIQNGIIDPVKVTRYALEHACSVVGLMLTTNCVIVEDDSD